jgi:hypothetical protein
VVRGWCVRRSGSRAAKRFCKREGGSVFIGAAACPCGPVRSASGRFQPVNAA